MTLAELVARWRARAEEAGAIGATAPVADFYRLVVAELEPLAGNGTPAPDAPDRLLAVGEAATRLGVSTKWLYRHRDALPFVRRIGPKALRVSAQGLERWVARQGRLDAGPRVIP